MKPIFLIVCLFLSITSFGQDFADIEASFEVNETKTSKIEWLTNLEKAQSVARLQNKPILVYFTGSDWCPPCIALKEDFFEHEDFASYAAHFVMVMIDYPRRIDILSAEQLAYNKKVVAKYNTSKSFPKLLLLDQNLSVRDKLSGYSSFNTYKDTSHHFAFVNKHSKIGNNK